MAWQCLGCLGVFFTRDQPDICPGGCRAGWLEDEIGGIRRISRRRRRRNNNLNRRRFVYERDNGICQLCREPVEWDDGGDYAPSLDHIVPLSKGGSNNRDNLQLAHRVCNQMKADRVPAGRTA